jgi:hypothetical protein
MNCVKATPHCVRQWQLEIDLTFSPRLSNLLSEFNTSIKIGFKNAAQEVLCRTSCAFLRYA